MSDRPVPPGVLPPATIPTPSAPVPTILDNLRSAGADNLAPVRDAALAIKRHLNGEAVLTPAELASLADGLKDVAISAGLPSEWITTILRYAAGSQWTAPTPVQSGQNPNSGAGIDTWTVDMALNWLVLWTEKALLTASNQRLSAASVAPDGAPAPEATGMTWQEAAERLERLRSQGELWTSQHEMARRFGCSSGTINKAIRNTPGLQTWAKSQTAAMPKAQSLTDVVTDRTVQSREPDPADDAAIREYLERDLTPEERAFFNSLSRDNQLDFLDDPDKHQRILGRKP
jgi:hypothetical protein